MNLTKATYGNWPKEPHPATGEEFTQCLELVTTAEVLENHMAPPEPPSRIVATAWDDEGDVLEERELNDIEFAQAQRAFKKAVKRYRETNGVVKSPGKVSTTGKFATTSGAWAQGQCDGEGRWLWATVST